ncbi:MAG: hypothetical protein LBS21_03300 [Clostridiales bacterium]|nr:hypothetical protein [Clostridiales bacterium]
MKTKYLPYRLKPDGMNGLFFHFVLLLSIFLSLILAKYINYAHHELSNKVGIVSGIIGIYVQLTAPIAGFLTFMVVCSAVNPKNMALKILTRTLLTAVYVPLYTLCLLYGVFASEYFGAEIYIFIATTVLGWGIIVLILSAVISYNRYLKMYELKRGDVINQVAQYASSKYSVDFDGQKAKIYFRQISRVKCGINKQNSETDYRRKRSKGEVYEQYNEFRHYETLRKQNKGFPFPIKGTKNAIKGIIFPKNAYDHCRVDIYQESENFTFTVFFDCGELTDNYTSPLF